jgi:hypothetical protein
MKVSLAGNVVKRQKKINEKWPKNVRKCPKKTFKRRDESPISMDCTAYSDRKIVESWHSNETKNGAFETKSMLGQRCGAKRRGG